MTNTVKTDLFSLSPAAHKDCLWEYRTDLGLLSFAPPSFEIDGHECIGFAVLELAETVTLHRGTTEHRWRGSVADCPGLTLELQARVSPGNPVVRFRYILHSARAHTMTKTAGFDSLTYYSVSFDTLSSVTEVRLSEFNEMVHSFCPSEHPVKLTSFEIGADVAGPILVGSDGAQSALLAYEHGAQYPDSFLTYSLGTRHTISLKAVKGNYWHGRVLDPDNSFETVWMHAALLDGNADSMAVAYREFILRHQSGNKESRKPYIFYNTWNHQERIKAWEKRPYLDDMNETRMLAEIDVAHRMGVDVFVIDTGWYQKTGDWRVNLERFPSGMKAITDRLTSYKMKLGLWFNPTVAALTSHAYLSHQDCVMTHQGVRPPPHEVWETEPSMSLCLVSRWADSFAAELIRLVGELGVTYFKWDAIGQYGCDDPSHNHGTVNNSDRERGDCYAFEQVRAMARVVDTLCSACPEAIVDFDITEGGRSVGLAFLSAGKYFLINNGPYNFNFDMPVPADGNVNLFFYPGPARAWICRTPLIYDKWIPTVLFLTHYLPDDHYQKYRWSGTTEVMDDSNQWICIASLVLGQNGIWGDLLALSSAGVDRIGAALAQYKRVGDYITSASLVRTGTVAGSPEVYEKIDPLTGRGVVSAFASAAGHYSFITDSVPDRNTWFNEGVTVTWDAAGHAVIALRFEHAGAKVVFFG